MLAVSFRRGEPIQGGQERTSHQRCLRRSEMKLKRDLFAQEVLADKYGAEAWAACTASPEAVRLSNGCTPCDEVIRNTHHLRNSTPLDATKLHLLYLKRVPREQLP